MFWCGRPKRQVVWGPPWGPQWVQGLRAKPWWGPRGRSPRKLTDSRDFRCKFLTLRDAFFRIFLVLFGCSVVFFVCEQNTYYGWESSNFRIRKLLSVGRQILLSVISTKCSNGFWTQRLTILSHKTVKQHWPYDNDDDSQWDIKDNIFMYSITCWLSKCRFIVCLPIRASNN